MAEPIASTVGSWPPDRAVLDALDLAVVLVADDGTVVWLNHAAVDLVGSTDEEPIVGRPLADVLFHQPEHGAVDEILRDVRAGGSWAGELLVKQHGAVAGATCTVAPVRDGESCAGMVLTVRDVGEGASAARLTGRLRRLGRVTAELLSADDIETVTRVVVEHAGDATGATVASLSLLVGDTLELAGLAGALEGAAERWARYPLTSDTPAAEAARLGRAVVLGSRDEIEARYPDLESAAEGERSMVCLPLIVGRRVRGVATLSFPGRRTIDTAEMEFLEILADTSAQALARIQAQAEAADQATRLEFLVDAGDELSSSLDYQRTLSNVARLAVPQYADWCAIALEDDGVLRNLAVAHADPAKVALAEEYQRQFPAKQANPTGPYAVLRSGRSELTPVITDDMLAAAVHDPEQLDLLRRLNFRSALMVPVRATGRVFGVLTLVTGENGRRFSEDDVAFAEELAHRAALAIEAAQTHSELKEVADRLQHAVRPSPLPDLADWELSAVYLPAGHADVGGDFFEVIPLDDLGIAVFVGDVMGRGVRAATAMSQMLAAVRSLTAVDPRPSAVVSNLDAMFAKFGLEELVTIVYAVIDVANREIVLTNAGHPPPVLVRRDGTVSQLGASPSMLLGAGGCIRTDFTAEFRRGDTLLAFTDGLVERRSENLEAGYRRLLENSPGLASTQLADALSLLVGQVRDPTRDDDVAVLAARWTADDGPPA